MRFPRDPAFLCVTILCYLAGAHAATPTSYRVKADAPRQTIWGLGVEIQFDSIGSGNDGLPTEIVAVPNNLTASERQRWYREMLSGFRYCRLAMGLYLRGLDAEQKHIIGRWATQMDEIRETIAQSGIEGVAPEYWSPAPYWKSNGSYIAGTIKSTGSAFLNDFGDAVAADLQYLESHQIPVSFWGLQNEPGVTAAYSSCSYSASAYAAAFAVVAPKIKAAFPGVLIHADSWKGPSGQWGTALRANPDNWNYLDGWSYHDVGGDSGDQIATDYNLNAGGKPVFNNEFEYLSGAMTESRLVNTAQSIMNWFVFQNSPTWFWLHALKPVSNSEAQGYALGYWRPPGDTDLSQYPTLAEGHWTWNPYNWNAISGFLRYLPWNSVRLNVEEDTVRGNNRVLAWKTPDGRIGVALTNRGSSPFTYEIDLGHEATFTGFRFNLANDNLSIGIRTGARQSISVPAYSIEFWVETTPRSEWRRAYWPVRPEGQDTLDTEDPDGDGRTNLVEYAVGSNPLSPNSEPILTLIPDSNGQIIIHPSFSVLQPDVRYILEASADLRTWAPLADSAMGSFPLTGLATGVSGAKIGFYRLRTEPQTTILPLVGVDATTPNAIRATGDPATFTITRSSVAGDLPVNYTFRGTATAGSDYVANPANTVVMRDGQQSATVTLTPVNDAGAASDETAILDIVPSSGYTLGTSTATVTISGSVIVDNSDPTAVVTTGSWSTSTFAAGQYYGSNYLHDGDAGKGSKTVRFTPTISVAGTYQAYAMWNGGSDRASKVPFTITDIGGASTIYEDERSGGGVWVSLGTYTFGDGTNGSVLISNAGTTGYVIADAVRFVLMSPSGLSAPVASGSKAVTSAEQPGPRLYDNKLIPGRSLPRDGRHILPISRLKSRVRAWIAENPNLTSIQLRRRLKNYTGISLTVADLRHQLDDWNVAFKRKPIRE